MNERDETLDDLVLLLEQDKAIFFDLVDDYERRLRERDADIAALRDRVEALTRELAVATPAPAEVTPTEVMPTEAAPAGRCALWCRRLAALLRGRA